MTPTSAGRSRLRRVAVGLATAWLLYVAGFEVAVRTGVAERLVNRRPHKFAVSFSSAHSWFPFWATASGIEARGQLPRLRWQATVDRASGWLVPWPLVERRLRLVHARAEGIALRALLAPEAAATAGPVPGSPDLPAAAAAASAPGLLPPIPPLAAPPPGPPPAPRWTIEVAGFEASGLRELWAEQFRLALAARAGGSLVLHLPERELEIPALAVEFDGGELGAGERILGEGLAGSARLALSPLAYREERGLAPLAHLSGDVTLGGRVSGGRFWLASLPPQEWLELDEEMAEVAGEVHLREGELRPGTRLEFRQDDYDARVLDFHVNGDVRGSFEVTGDASGARAEGRAGFHDYSIRRGGAERPDLVGTGLTVAVTSRDLQLAELAGLAAVAHVDLGEARVPDLSTLGDLIPPSAGLLLTGGSGRAGGEFDLALPAVSGAGKVWVDLDDVAVRYQEIELLGRMRLDLALATPALPAGRFDLAGSRFALTEFKSPQIAAPAPDDVGWWARIELPAGELDLPPQTAASGTLRIHLRDSVPFVGLFETRKNLPKWVERWLSVPDLEAESGFAYRGEEFTLDEFTMPFKKFRLRARTRFGPEHKTGILLVSWHRLMLGVRFDDGRRRLKLTGVADWYARQGLELATAPEALDPEELFAEEAVAMVPFAGVAESPVALADAEVEAEESGAAPPFAIVPGSVARGDLDGDGRDEAALLLERAGEDGTPVYFLAALAEREGRAENVATLALGPRPAPGRLRVEAGLVVLEPAPPEPAAPAADAAPAAAAPPPPERWRLAGGALDPVPAAPAPPL